MKDAKIFRFFHINILSEVAKARFFCHMCFVLPIVNSRLSFDITASLNCFLDSIFHRTSATNSNTMNLCKYFLFPITAPSFCLALLCYLLFFFSVKIYKKNVCFHSHLDNRGEVLNKHDFEAPADLAAFDFRMPFFATTLEFGSLFDKAL